MSNILFEFDQFYHLIGRSKEKHPVQNAIKTLKSLDQNGHGVALSVTKNEEGLVVTKCGVPLLETMNWLHANGINNFNVAVSNPNTVPDLITFEKLFEGDEIPTGKGNGISWYAIANKLVDKGYIQFTDFT